MALNPKISLLKSGDDLSISNITDNFGINGNPARTEVEIRYEIFLLTSNGNKTLVSEYGNEDAITHTPNTDGIYQVMMYIEGEDLCFDVAEITCLSTIDKACIKAKAEWLANCDQSENMDFIRMVTMRDGIDCMLELGMTEQAAEIVSCLNDFLRIKGICETC